MTEAGNVRYEYGETGGVQREIGAVHELVYSYQDERVRGITGNLPGGEQVEVTYGYDALGRRTSRRNGNDDHAIRTVYEGLSINSVMTLETDRVFAGGITGTGVNRDTGSAGTGRYRRSDGPGAGLSRPASLETRTVRMGSTAVAQMTGGGDGEITFYGHDILGSVTARFSDRGQRVEELEYRAFGELRRGELTTEHPYGYTGKPMDPTTGIYDYGFRDYAPELARFTTVDPVRDGNNWYAYVGNDPVNFVDPLGLERAAGVGAAEEPTESVTTYSVSVGAGALLSFTSEIGIAIDNDDSKRLRDRIDVFGTTTVGFFVGAGGRLSGGSSTRAGTLSDLDNPSGSFGIDSVTVGVGPAAEFDVETGDRVGWSGVAVGGGAGVYRRTVTGRGIVGRARDFAESTRQAFGLSQ